MQLLKRMKLHKKSSRRVLSSAKPTGCSATGFSYLAEAVISYSRSWSKPEVSVQSLGLPVL